MKKKKKKTEAVKANHEIAKVKAYLKRKGVKATEAEIITAAINLTRRLGPGD